MSITKVSFKKPHTSLEVAGQTFNDGNITVDAYQKLVKLNPNFGDLFDVVSDEDATEKENDKPKKQGQSIRKSGEA